MKKFVPLIGTFVFLMILLGPMAVTFAGPLAAQAPADLAGSRWVLVSYRDKAGNTVPAQPEVNATLEFRADEIAGSTGCNTYTAPYEAKNGALKIGMTATTMRMCALPIMNQESAFIKAIQSVAAYQIAGDQLTLLDAQGAPLLTFRIAVPGSLTGVTWLLTAYSNGQGGVQSALEDVRATATFDEAGSLSGSTGCNTYVAPYQAQDGKLTVGMTATTMKMCATAIMAQESAFIKAIQAAASYAIEGDQLTIQDAQGATLLTFRAEQPGTLTGSTWTMTYYNNGRGGFESALADVQVTAVFGADGRLTGNSGCNTYSASYTIVGDRLQISPALNTRKACAPPIMEQEAAYLQALETVTTFSIEGDRLLLRTADNTNAVEFIRQSAAPAKQAEAAPAAIPTPVPAPTTQARIEAVYVTILPAADASTRSIVLELKADGTAHFTSDYGSGKVVIQRGTWMAQDADLLTVILTEQDGEKMARPMMLKFRRDDTYLILTEYDKAIWGEQGLKLNQVTDVARKARSAMVTLDLEAGFPLDPTFVSVNGGGEVDARLLGHGCAGYIHRQPIVKVNWSGQADRARVFFYSDGDPTLVVLTPKGELLCNDNAHAQLLDPFVEIEKPAVGEYRIWVGSAARNQLIPGVLVLTTKSTVDLGTFELGKLIKRPPIPQQVIRPTTPVMLNPQVQAIFDRLVKAAPAMKPGSAKLVVSVTAEGEVPLFRIPPAVDKGCAGLVTGAPSYAFKWNGTTDNLRITFTGDADSTLMVIGQESKLVLCNDDAQAGSIHPMIDIPNPADDTYLVYVGRISAEKPVKGTLTVAETPKE